jgi:Carboxypeptidase regulatory-like domain
MNVTSPSGWGKIAGTVSGQDCSNTIKPVRAVVFATGEKGFSFTLKTDANGNYAFWAPEGGSPFSLIASASGWIAQTQSVNIKAGKTTTQNFTLRPQSC